MMSSDVGGATLVGTVRRGVAKSSTSLRDSDMPWALVTFGGSRTCATGMGEVSGTIMSADVLNVPLSVMF